MDAFLKWAAIATAAIVIGATVYSYLHEEAEKGELNYRLANLRLEDELYEEALREFDEALRLNPDHAPSHLGRALALMGLGASDAALQAFASAMSHRPDFAAAYANRGILRDRMERHEAALADYRRALELEPDLGDGPDWITRLMRNQPDAPPTIADRAAYLETELRKPVGARTLRIAERDDAQRSYKYEAE